MRKLKLEELGRVSASEFKKVKKNPIVIVLDNIRSGMNVGSFFRTSDAFALEKIVLSGISARPPHKEINKTAIGADRSVDWIYEEKIVDAIEKLKLEGFRIIGIEQTDSSQMLQTFAPESDNKYALVFGNEVNGLSDEVLPLLDTCIEIPQFGTKHSLNVSVSAGIVLWQFMQHYLQKA